MNAGEVLTYCEPNCTRFGEGAKAMDIGQRLAEQHIRFCIPKAAQPGNITAVLKSYAERHPDKARTYDIQDFIGRALAEEYPCRRKP